MSNADWWAKKLGGQPAPRPADIPMPPSQQPMTRGIQTQQPQQPMQKAQSANQVTPCPECGGNNYMAVQQAAARCYDCGYPLVQSGSHYGQLNGAKVEGSVKEARGNDTVSNFNPQGIIGRIN
jgi:ribosomal protein L37E